MVKDTQNAATEPNKELEPTPYEAAHSQATTDSGGDDSAKENKEGNGRDKQKKSLVKKGDHKSCSVAWQNVKCFFFLNPCLKM